MTAGSSPGTSEIAKRHDPRRRRRGGEPPALDRREVLSDRVDLADRRAGAQQGAASPPACRRASGPAPAGSASAEPPPETRQTSWSSGPSPCASARMSRGRLLARPRRAPGGSPRRSRMRSQGTPWPCRVTTRPSSGPPLLAGQAFSKARAIAAEALPAPTTTVRPATGGGRCGVIARAGSAAASAASNRARSNSRAAWSRVRVCSRAHRRRLARSIRACHLRRHFISSAPEKPVYYIG